MGRILRARGKPLVDMGALIRLGRERVRIIVEMLEQHPDDEPARRSLSHRKRPITMLIFNRSS